MTDTLLSRLQDAPVGTRELDAHVEVAVRAIEAARTGLPREHWAKWEACHDGYVQDPHTRYASNPVTTSLDAALALAERVLPKCWPGWQKNRYVDDAERWSAFIGFGGDPPSVEADAHTPALALCAAIIAAKEGDK